jgi:hypothetical protein
VRLFGADGAPLRRRIGYIAGFERISAISDISLTDCIGSSHTQEDRDFDAETPRRRVGPLNLSSLRLSVSASKKTLSPKET